MTTISAEMTDGRSVTGTYNVKQDGRDRYIEVMYDGEREAGSKCTNLSAPATESLAKIILRQLAERVEYRRSRREA
jgi:hypothetical protein